MNDLYYILRWWLVFFAIGITFLPLTSYIFQKFYDRGYLFSKVIGITLISYVVFVLSTLKITTFHQTAIIFVTALFAILQIIIFKTKINIKTAKKMIWIMCFEELLFLLCLIFWGYVRAHDPKINGLEKFMDFGFVNSILRSEYLPPTDIWFPPFNINYYYFGHFVTALLTKLSYLPSYITYNLMIATLFALTLTLSFSLTLNIINETSEKLKKSSILVGILAALLVSLGGNLHMIYSFFTPYNVEKPVPFWTQQYTPSSFPNNYWYPNATRFIPFTIHEFPLYSFVVSDLHGHVIDIPFVFLTIALLFSLFTRNSNGSNNETQNAKLKMQNHLPHRQAGNSKFKIYNFLSSKLQPLTFDFGLLTLLALMLAIMYMTNAWDGLIYFFLTAIILVVKNLYHPNHEISEDSKFKILNIKFSLKISNFKLKILESFKHIVLLGIGSAIFLIPFNYSFKPFVSGIGVICTPSFLIKIERFGPLLFEKDHCQTTPLWMLMILYGFFYWFIIFFIAFIINKIGRFQDIKSNTQNYILQFRLSNILDFKLRFFTFNFRLLTQSDIFVLALILVSTLLIVTPEFIYMKDIYPSHYRANTMFKLAYQAFMMLSIASAYIFVRIMAGNITKLFKVLNMYFIFFIISVFFFVLVMIYPNFAVSSYYGELKNYKGLDGIKYLKDQNPGDFEAITWLNKNIKNQPVILEAQGDSYTDYARISSNTGLPTVLGWPVHEWLWRGSYDVPSPRIQEITDMYTSQDLNLTKNLLKKHNVEYVYVGALERQKYQSLNEEKFKSLAKVIYENRSSKIYKIF